MPKTNSEETIEQLRELTHEHRVCYEVWPEYLMLQGQRVQVGFQLELCGIRQCEGEPLTPGCQYCYKTFVDLRKIAEWIMPQERRPSRYEISIFDGAIHSVSKRRFRPEVVLNMKIVHREGFDQPVDKCEELCLKEMRQKLRELGVPEGNIPSPHAPNAHARSHGNR
jgi:hypothetical protein